MSYEMLKGAAFGDILPLIMEMNKLKPTFIDSFIIDPILNYQPIEDPTIKKSSYENLTPEDFLIKILKNSKSIEDVNLIYQKLKDKKYTLSRDSLSNLLNSFNINIFENIFIDNLETVKTILKNISNRNDTLKKGVVFFIEKNNINLAKILLLQNEEKIEDIIKKIGVGYINNLAILMKEIDPSISISEAETEIYRKMIDNVFTYHNVDRTNVYSDQYGIAKLKIWQTQSNYYDFMVSKMGQMPEDILYKSFLLGFKDDSIFTEHLTKLLKKLKITKSSLEYANMVVDSLDMKVNLKKFKKELYSFNESFWTEKNLITSFDGIGLSRGMKMLLDMDMSEKDWEEKSLVKVKKIYFEKLIPHKQAIYEDYINRRCFELPLVREQVQKILAKSESVYLSKHCLENTHLNDFVEKYLNIKDKNNIKEDEYQRIKNIVDFYTQKLEGNNYVTSVSKKTNLHSKKINNNRFCTDVFLQLKDYKDIVLNILKEKNSCIDNNMVFYALNEQLITQSDLDKADYKFTYKSLNDLTENDLKVFKEISVRQGELPKSFDTILNSFLYDGINITLLPQMKILVEEMKIQELVYSSDIISNPIKKVNKF